MIRCSIAVLAISCGGGGSSTPPVDAVESGRACTIGATPSDPTVLASPALECPSRICLHVGGFQPDHCTTRCSDDADCAAGGASACTAGFRRAPVVAVGPFACQSMCICSDRAPAVMSGCP